MAADRDRPADVVDTQHARKTKAERVDHIVSLMASGQWVTGQTGTELAAEWGMAAQTLRVDAAEASRIVREAVAGSEDIKARVLSTLETITQRAMQRDELRTAIESVKALASISGAGAAERHEVTAAVGVARTPADARAIMAEVFRKDDLPPEPNDEPGSGGDP